MSLYRTTILIDHCKHYKTLILVDAENADSILPYLMQDGVDIEFKRIRNILKENLRNRMYYCKCEVSAKARDMFEMRFTGQGRNDRIYCKEVHTGNKRCIILAELFEGKKSQNIPARIRGRIENIGCNYLYNFK